MVLASPLSFLSQNRELEDKKKTEWLFLPLQSVPLSPVLTSAVWTVDPPSLSSSLGIFKTTKYQGYRRDDVAYLTLVGLDFLSAR